MPKRVMAKEVLLQAWLSKASVVEKSPRMMSFSKVAAGSAGISVEVAMSNMKVMMIPLARSAS